jgi:hypothetical protein
VCGGRERERERERENMFLKVGLLEEIKEEENDRK